MPDTVELPENLPPNLLKAAPLIEFQLKVIQAVVVGEDTFGLSVPPPSRLKLSRLSNPTVR
jgi:hypothetical protein